MKEFCGSIYKVISTTGLTLLIFVILPRWTFNVCSKFVYSICQDIVNYSQQLHYAPRYNSFSWLWQWNGLSWKSDFPFICYVRCVVWTGDGRVFFYNPSTRSSVWEKPDDLKNRVDVDKMIAGPPEGASAGSLPGKISFSFSINRRFHCDILATEKLFSWSI